MSRLGLFAPPILLASLLPLAGCGGGGGGGGGALLPPPDPVVVDLPAVPELEGYVAGVAVLQGTPLLVVGDNSADETFTTFFAFDLTGVGAVTAATLHLEPSTVVGDPYALGDFTLDHVDAGASLDSGDVAGGTLSAAFLTFTSADPWDFDVTEQVRADVAAGRTTSTFRVRFPTATDGNGQNDLARIVSSDHPTVELHPRLTATFTP